MAVVRIALANIPYPASPNESVGWAERAIADAAKEKAAIVCFPESYIPGYRGETWVRPPADPLFLERAWARIEQGAAKAGITVALGTERPGKSKPRISVLVINPDGTRAGWQDKVQLDPSEDSEFEPGNERQVFEAGPLRFGFSICHEGFRYPETVRWSARRGAHIVFHPHYHWAEGDSYRPASFGDPKNTFHEKSVLCRAAENTVYVASINYASEGSGTTSVFVNPDGTVLSWQPYGKAGLLVADIDTDNATGLLAKRLSSQSQPLSA
jgi:predicted amidohydrolase